uniref:Sulfatase domain-containing protein n=1 Tax=Parastrongyloides trichosuri TaxID=131310 RepID=A0A0N4Z3C7_PARTI
MFSIFRNETNFNIYSKETFKQYNTTNIDYCIFTKYDIWDKKIFKYISPASELEVCEKKYVNDYYKINDGILVLTKLALENICTYSCQYPKNDFEINSGPQILIKNEVKLDCDVFYFVCKDTSEKILFEDVAFHIRKIDKFQKEKAYFLNPKFNIPKKNKKYDVHIYVIDSLSNFHAKRALRKTRKYLLEKFEAIEMEYLNVIADNSRPNAYGFLLNKQEIDVVDYFGLKKIKYNDFGNVSSCEFVIDNTTYIQEYYRKMGYVTMKAEDFFYAGAFNWPNCTGIINSPAYHSLRPFQVLRYNSPVQNVAEELYKNKCYNNGFYLHEYMEKFLNKYKNKLKMSLVWHTNILHDSLDNIFSGDKLFETFYKNNAHHFDNSFHILMGDHGFRLSEYISTDIGGYEQKNPYFLISLPKPLRKNKKLIEILKLNKYNHISHLDVYATLIDILTNAPNDNYGDWDKQKNFPIINDKVKGLSLLRPLPSKNRTCYDMFIPPQYCMCTPKFTLLPMYNTKERNELKKNFIAALNNKIVIGNLTEKCAEMKIDESEIFTVKVARNENQETIYEVDIVTQPGKAIYRSMFDKNFKSIRDEIIRMNVYKDQAEVCEKTSDYRKFCYCKSLLS